MPRDAYLNMCNIVASGLFALTKIARVGDSYTKRVIYHGMILLHIHFGTILWDASSVNNKLGIFKIQKWIGIRAALGMRQMETWKEAFASNLFTNPKLYLWNS